MNRHDGHIHTPYCPHGSRDSLKSYVENAVFQGFAAISFMEHAPLPESFNDPAPTKDSAMTLHSLDNYLQDCERIKEEYQEHIKILTGLEVDYIAGYENETATFLNQWGPRLDDSILSVHFLTLDSRSYSCIDYSKDTFQTFLTEAGSLEKVYQCYYNTLIQAASADLGAYKPARLGHMTLIRKFQNAFPRKFSDTAMIENVLETVENHGMSLDINGAGLYKPDCREVYPPKYVVETAKKRGIQLVYGSDAHTATAVGQGSGVISPWIHSDL
ncbi:histidinol-phosphatase HisJ [Salisediminibacterium halotolerans]|uniref:histidinol-phosphatase HisJ n=1 Tax=Salisediminibacterium halotolerans TaxID=517425 RepID=UPI000EB32C3C|nr:histidinol-phosphatase HisJ [Salisediminibacterium halotolerans]RLJ69376.1 histidinol-phosphatase (PHP family) [Actinophytocola xinjiangensis]RPE83998.1 histidinol-phosphatase (PHP family) [Salisediminibacterium halotolerans]TWG32451.1 histidinol-phosphatase (PHP family) [Salisediminibacterium halotolerans]GEL07331.1 histidinol-phosphatase [Salisediminibacterium halotolerans]